MSNEGFKQGVALIAGWLARDGLSRWLVRGVGWGAVLAVAYVVGVRSVTGRMPHSDETAGAFVAASGVSVLVQWARFAIARWRAGDKWGDPRSL